MCRLLIFIGKEHISPGKYIRGNTYLCDTRLSLHVMHYCNWEMNVPLTNSPKFSHWNVNACLNNADTRTVFYTVSHSKKYNAKASLFALIRQAHYFSQLRYHAYNRRTHGLRVELEGKVMAWEWTDRMTTPYYITGTENYSQHSLICTSNIRFPWHPAKIFMERMYINMM